MDKENKKFYTAVVLLLTLFLYAIFMGMYAFAYYHELAHVQIFEYFGYEADFIINPFGTSYTYSMDYHELDKDMELLHSLNEIVGYHFMGLIWNFWIMFAIFMSFLIIRRAKS